jgi:hypothetical protein
VGAAESGGVMSAQRSELVAYLTDYQETTAPLNGPALRLTLVADVAFIGLGQMKEERGTETFTSDDAQTIGVDAELLLATLLAMLRRDDRSAAERLSLGELPSDHPSLVVAPVAGLALAIRRRA